MYEIILSAYRQRKDYRIAEVGLRPPCGDARWIWSLLYCWRGEILRIVRRHCKHIDNAISNWNSHRTSGSHYSASISSRNGLLSGRAVGTCVVHHTCSTTARSWCGPRVLSRRHCRAGNCCRGCLYLFESTEVLKTMSRGAPVQSWKQYRSLWKASRPLENAARDFSTVA